VTVVGARRQRGGNRLSPDRYPVRGPSYERRRVFPDDPERRDRNQRNRTRRAVGMALTRGRLSDRLASLLSQLLDRCDDRLLGPAPDDGAACSGWWTLKYIHDLILPPDQVDDEEVADINEGEDVSDAGARTAGRWMSKLDELGWVNSIHRHRPVYGEKWGTSNLWRIRIPDDLRAELYELEDSARSRSAARRQKRSGPGRATPRSTGDGRDRQAAAAVLMAKIADARRLAPCSTCDTGGWVPAPGDGGGFVRCGDCNGSGTTRPP
jgi:hypothetical protein